MYKKILSVLLVVAMLMGMAVNVFATEAEPKADINVTLRVIGSSLPDGKPSLSSSKADYKGAEYQNWMKIALPMVLVWVIWLGVEAYMILNEDGIYLYFMGGALVGGLIGGFIGTRINNKVKREAEELLEQIKEYSELKK